MSDQGDFFNGESARAAKADGMALVEKGANPKWIAFMEICLVEVARAKQTFTSDDVFRYAASKPDAPATRDRRAFGPIMMRAIKQGVCVRANTAPIPSSRRSLHASPRQVWRSLIS